MTRIPVALATLALSVATAAGLCCFDGGSAAGATPAALPTCNGTVHTDLGGGDYLLLPGRTGGGAVNCLLAQGNAGKGVARLQHNLNVCHSAHLREDGIFGSGTKSALESAQRGANIAADGVYGSDSRNYIRWPRYHPGHSTHVGCSSIYG